MAFLGLFTFTAPYLPWVLLGFSVLLGNSPSVDLMGIGVGHLYYFFDDVFPLTRGGKGRRPLRCPRRLARLVDGAPHAAWEGAGFVLQRADAAGAWRWREAAACFAAVFGAEGLGCAVD